MEQIYNRIAGLVDFQNWSLQNFEDNWQIYIKTVVTTIKEAVKEDLIIRDSQQEDSKNENSDTSNRPSNEISSYENSLNEPSTSDVLTSKGAYCCNNIGLSFVSEEDSLEQAPQNDYSLGASDTLKYLNVNSEIILHSGQDLTEEAFGNKCQKSSMKRNIDCENSDDEYFIQPVTPNNLKSVFLRADSDPHTEDIENKVGDICRPAEKLVNFFVPPKMPKELLIALSYPRLVDTARTEKLLYSAQKEQYLQANLLIVSLFQLNKLVFELNKHKTGDSSGLCQLQFLITRSLQSVLSSSLYMSKARRENVRPLLKDKAGKMYKKSLPTIESLFGCTKIDLNKHKKKCHKKRIKPMNKKCKKH